MNANHLPKCKQQPLIAAVDLFCGAGGLTRGLKDANVQVNLGVDFDANCKFPYEYNNEASFLHASVTDINAKQLKDGLSGGTYSLLAGCAPCQTFSSYNAKANESDKRWWLLQEFARLVNESKPTFITMENVPGLKEQDVFRQFVATLEKLKYHLWFDVVNAADYGLPQNRRRLVLIGSKLGPIELLKPEQMNAKPKSVQEAIGQLRYLGHGEVDPKDPLHQAAKLSDLNFQRMIYSKPGGTWRDWPKYLVADCHKKDSGSTFASVYGRMKWDAPAPTMTTQYYGFGNGRFGHPEQDRAISLREGAIFQGFPKDYQFIEKGKPFSKSAVARMIGNAVPVKLGEVIGKSFQKHISLLNN